MTYFTIQHNTLYSVVCTYFGGDALNFVKTGDEGELRALALSWGWMEAGDY